MFYAHFVLAKKGPLARIWLAAHWDKKLTKAHVFETNIESSVEGILQPKVKMALRTSGHLLLGIVRIYSRKAKYLLADCNEAFIKIKMAFRPGIVDLPEENREAAVATITLPEVFHDFDTTMPDITIDMDAQVTLNQSRAEDITLKEDYGTLSLMADDGFGDMGFDDPEVARDATNIDEGFDHASLLLGEDKSKEKPDDTLQSTSSAGMSNKPNVSLDAPLKDDGFGGAVGEGLLDGETGGLFEPAGLFDDAPLGHVPMDTNQTDQVESEQITEKPPEPQPAVEDSDDDMYDMGPASMGAPSPPSSPESPVAPAAPEDKTSEPEPPPEGLPGVEGPPTVVDEAAAVSSDANSTTLPADSSPAAPAELPAPPPPPVPNLDQPPLMPPNEEESFALAPLDAIVHGTERTVKAKRKRKLIVDEVKNISGEEMKSQLSDTTDIVTTLDLAPPTKRLMHWKETGGVEKLFALPGHPILSKTLSRMYQRHLTTRSVENEDFGIEDDRIDLDADLEQPRDDDEVVARKRRREMEPLIPQDLSHLDSIHLESSRPSYPQEHSMPHPSLEIPPPPPYMQQSLHMFPTLPSQQMPEPPPQMVSPVMAPPPPPPPPQHPAMPPGMPHPQPAHVMHQMLPPEVTQLSHIPQMMHPPNVPVDQGQLLTMAQNMHDIQPPVVPEPFQHNVHHSVIEPVPQHMVPERMPLIMDHIQQQPPLEKQINHSPMQIHHQVIQEQPTVNHIDSMEGHTIQPCIERQQQQQQTVQPCVDGQQPVQQTNLEPCPSTPTPPPPQPEAQHEEVTNPCLNGPVTPTQVDEPEVPLNLNNERNPLLPDSENTMIESAAEAEENHQPSKENDNVPEDTELPEAEKQDERPAEEDALEIAVPNDQEIAVEQGMPNDQGIPVEDARLGVSETNDKELCQQQQSDDEDDYGAPSSVGPILPEEQMADETYEQFEERILTKRTTHMLHIIHSRLDSGRDVVFEELVRNSKRKQVAQKFYTFLVLKKQQAVELKQDKPYGDLIITKGPKFDIVYNAA